jgi:hypothetical protein
MPVCILGHEYKEPIPVNHCHEQSEQVFIHNSLYLAVLAGTQRYQKSNTRNNHPYWGAIFFCIPYIHKKTGNNQ